MLIKLYEIKAISPITKNIETDIGIVKPIFKSRIMDLGNASVDAMINGDKIEVNVYDGDVLEIEFEIDNLNNVEFKGKKKTKIFNK